MTNEKRMSGFVKKLTAALLALAVIFAALPFLPAGMEADASTTITSVVLYTDGSLPEAGGKVFYPGVLAVNESEELADLIDLENSYVEWYYDNGGDELAAYESSTFKSGYVYDLYVELSAESGARFADDCSIILATEDSVITGYMYGVFDSYSSVGYDFYFNLQKNVKKVTSVNFKTTSPDPKTGNAVFSPTLCSVNGSASSKDLLSAVECQWGYRIINTEVDYETYDLDKFDPGNEYMYIVVMGAADTSAFDPNCKVTLTTASGTHEGVLLSCNDLVTIAAFLFETPPEKELKIIKQPVDISGPYMENVEISIEAEGDDLRYTWYVKNKYQDKFQQKEYKSTNSTYPQCLNYANDGNTIYCVVSDKYGNTIKSDEVTVWVNELIITQQPSDGYVTESGYSTHVEIYALGEDITYAWYYKGPDDSEFIKGNSTTKEFSAKLSDERPYIEVYCVITDKHGNSLKSDTVKRWVAQYVNITKQPVSTAVYDGDIAEVTFEATGDNLEYIWFIKNAGDSEFSRSSVTTNTYSVEMNEARNGREVFCRIEDRYGRSKVTDTVTLSMIPTELKITKQPVSASVLDGDTAEVSVEAQGDGLTYQWWIKNPGDTAYSKSSITTATYSTNMTEAKDGRILRCVVKDKYGNLVRSDIVTINIKPATELKITKQPVSASALKGDTVKVSLEAQGDGLTYQWWIKNPGDTAYSKSSITTAAYSTNMTEAKDGRILRCVVKDRYGNLVRSDIVTINMIPATELKITKQPVSASALKGDTVKVSLEAQGDGLTYQWWIKNPGDSAYSKSSITTSTYATNMTEAKDGRILRCVVKDRYGNLVRSDIVTISMKAATELKITKQPVSASAEIGKYVSVSVEAEGDGLTYQWWIKNPGDSAYSKSSITSATYTTNMTAAKDGRILRCVVKDKYGNLIRSDIVTINVK